MHRLPGALKQLELASPSKIPKIASVDTVCFQDQITKLSYRRLIMSKPKYLPPQNQVFISQSAVENANDEIRNYEILDDLGKGYSTLVHDCGAKEADLNEKVPPLFEFHQYISEVNNGGHSQHCGNWYDKKGDWEKIRTCLIFLKASDHLEIFEQYIDWVDANGEEAQLQTGFHGGISDFLDELDKRFFDLEHENGSIIYKLNNWILAWAETTVVSDGSLRKCYLEQAYLDTDREKYFRKSVLQYFKYRISHTDDQQKGYLINTYNGRPHFTKKAVGGSLLSLFQRDKAREIWVVDNHQELQVVVLYNEWAGFYVRDTRGWLERQLSSEPSVRVTFSKAEDSVENLKLIERVNFATINQISTYLQEEKFEFVLLALMKTAKLTIDRMMIEIINIAANEDDTHDLDLVVWKGGGDILYCRIDETSVRLLSEEKKELSKLSKSKLANLVRDLQNESGSL